MPRRKRIVIEKVIKDPMITKFRSIDVKEINEKRAKEEQKLHESIEETVKKAKELYAKERLEKEKWWNNFGLLTISDAYEELKKNGYDISFRAFGGRIERGSVYSEKIGNKRYIPKPVIEDMLAISNEFYTVRQAYEELKKSEDMNLRAFIGRIEKNSIPSVKIGSKRLIPKSAIESLTHIAKNYYDVADAIKILHSKGIKIRRNAFERRLDRNCIPHEKIGGKRFIAKEVLDELIQKELLLMANKK
jgi:hypothetical protein